MPEAREEEAAVPQEILTYMRGPAEASLQFDFLIGEWDIEGCRRLPDGSEQRYTGRWHAKYLHGKRMIIDDFAVFSPAGDEISAFITLRTYCPGTKRWEMAGMGAFQPAVKGEWFGEKSGDEMHLHAKGPAPNGDVVNNRIRFYEIEDDRFKWESQMSFDGGEHWARVASMVATRTS